MSPPNSPTSGTAGAQQQSDPDGPTSSDESRPLLPTFSNHSVEAEGESGRTGLHIVHFCKILWRSSSQVSMLVNVLWPFVPIAIVLRYAFSGLHVWIFAMSYIGMVAPANLLGFAGQELARKMPKVAGILVETALGSIVEIILFLILIKKHSAGEDSGAAVHGNLIPVIQAAILGSILTNLLLCLGLCFFVGGLRQKVQSFHAAVSEVGTGLLLVAGFGLLIPSAFYSSLKSAIVPVTGHSETEVGYSEKQLRHDTLKISQITSIILIIAFLMCVSGSSYQQDK
jgi:Ca2+:H+ antiporter